MTIKGCKGLRFPATRGISSNSSMQDMKVRGVSVQIRWGNILLLDFLIFLWFCGIYRMRLHLGKTRKNNILVLLLFRLNISPWIRSCFQQESPPAWTQEAYRSPRSHSNFLLFWGGGVPWQKFFSPVWTCIKPNLVSKNFPFTWGGGPSTKIFFPVWTCMKPNLVSKIFPFTGGGSLDKNFFSQSEHVSSQIWCQKIFSLLRPPRDLEQKSETWNPPLKIWDLGPPTKNLRPGTSPLKSETWDLPRKSETWDLGPPPPKCRQTENITFRHPSDGGR